jgi:cytochrome c
MTTKHTLGAVMATLVWAGAGSAAELTDGQARHFFNEKGCNGCHDIEEAHLAPSFRSVSSRYSGDKDGRMEELAQKIIHGGAGNWGVVPMISNPKVTPEEARAVASWILTFNVRHPAK